MSVLLTSVRIVDASSPYHLQVKDIWIEDGTIRSIADKIEPTASCQVISFEKASVSQGWIDSSVCVGEPGFEERETINNAQQTAAKSGFTAFVLQPTSHPKPDHASVVRQISEKASQHAVQVYPMGSLTMGGEGKNLAELFDLKKAGAVAFGDYKTNFDNSLALKIALEYVKPFGGKLVVFACDPFLKGKGVVHESEANTQLGLKAYSPLAESVMIARNLQILAYTEGEMHIPTISTAESVELIRQAKKQGLKVSCSVSVAHLLLSDEKLQSFGTAYKLHPPLRDDKHRKALIEGVLDGTIDSITTDHCPVDIEHKKLEFDHAMDGSIGLEAAAGALGQLFPTEMWVEKLVAARSIFGLERNSIREGEKANLTLFNDHEEWIFSEKYIHSTSKNCAFIGEKMKGRALGVIIDKTVLI